MAGIGGNYLGSRWQNSFKRQYSDIQSSWVPSPITSRCHQDNILWSCFHLVSLYALKEFLEGFLHAWIGSSTSLRLTILIRCHDWGSYEAATATARAWVYSWACHCQFNAMVRFHSSCQLCDCLTLAFISFLWKPVEMGSRKAKDCLVSPRRIYS